MKGKTSLGYVNLGTFKNNFATLPLNLVWVSTNMLPVKRAVRCVKTGVLRPIRSQGRRSAAEGDEDEG